MATTDKSQNEIITAWQSLIEQSVKANTAFLKESAKIFTSLLSKKIDAKDLLKINTEVLNAAANNFIKLNVANTENLVNFGVSISRGLFSFAEKKSADDNDPAKEADISGSNTSTNGHTKNQINLSVKQGGRISTSFYLNSHNAFAQNGKFNYGDFFEEFSGKKGGLSVSISPLEFILEPGKSLKIDISITATSDTNPGKYKSMVRLEGMDNQEFELVIDVAENDPQSIEKTPKHTPVVKKRIPKKAAKKRVAKK